ncbi:MAG TPA: phosphatase PAP2 family protein [Candidatus Choladousia intestinigallinarum]|nr:phosphatase PAP2 family protein [Candidatus Choladousia intestinigallinarum]
MEALQMAEGSILLWIQEFLRADWLTPVMLTITKLGNLGFIWVVLSLLFLCFRKTRWAGAAGLLAVFFSLAFNNYFLKNLFERIRPYEVIDGLTLLVHKASDFSFPSGHAGSSFAAATAFFWILRGKIGAAAYVLAFLIAFSRLYIGIHYPTDVLCGMITGSLCGLAAGVLINKAKSKLEEFKAAKSR